MVKLWAATVGTVLFAATSVTPVAAGGERTYLWDPPVDNEANVYNRIIELKHAGDLNGKLLSTWEHWYVEGYNASNPNGTEGSFIIRESDDGGNTWSTLTAVKDTQQGPGHPVVRSWQPFLFEFPHQLGDYPEGTLLLAGNLVPLNKTITEFFTWRSIDHGKTWESVGVWQRGGTTTAGIWEPFLYLDSEGRLVALFSDERDAENHSQMLVHVVSDDGGDTWGEVVRDAASADQLDRPGMPWVALMGNGEYIMSYEVCGRTGWPVFTKTSKDGVTWDAGDVGTPVTSDGVYPGSSPYIIWDESTKQLVLGSKSVWKQSDDSFAPQHQRAVFINKNYGSGEWSWATPPWKVSNASEACNSNYSPHLLPRGDGVVRYTSPTSWGSTGLCSEKTRAAPIGVLPYQANFSSDGQLGWINFGGEWYVSDDVYVAAVTANSEAKAVIGSTGWTDYKISADVMTSGSDGVVGLIARVTSPDTGAHAFNEYTAAINTYTGNLTVSRQEHDFTVLESAAVDGGVQGEKWYHLSFAVKDSGLTATLSADGYPLTVAVLGEDNHSTGVGGLWANLNSGKFKNVNIG